MRYFATDKDNGVLVQVFNGHTFIFTKLVETAEQASDLIKALKFEYDNDLYE